MKTTQLTAFSIIACSVFGCDVALEPTAPTAPSTETEIVAPQTQNVQPFQNPYETVADYLDCLREQDVMLISAHRGGPADGFPENALETFAETLRQAPMLIETDVRMTADGLFVLLHDEELQRTTTGFGELAETSFGDLQDVKLKDNKGRRTDFDIPALEEALDWARGRAFLQLDVKRGAPIEAVVDAVAAAEAQSYAAVIAYTKEDAIKAAMADPEITISIQILSIDQLDALEDAGVPADRIMAWTGIETERPELWQALNKRGVSAAWGSLWYLDKEIEESGDDSQFARLAEEGLDILSSDMHMRAYKAVEKRQDTNTAIATCNAG